MSNRFELQRATSGLKLRRLAGFGLSVPLRDAARRAWSRLPCASRRVLVEPYTMLSRERLVRLEKSVRAVVRNGVEGQLVECGAAAGGSAALLALWAERLGSDKKVYVFDTFEGLPPPTDDDPDREAAGAWIGKCRGELADVKHLFQSLGVADRGVFVKGLFQDTLPISDVRPIALLHLDGDWYESTMTCLQHLWDRVSPGGIVQIDDYGCWEGCRKAVDEFFCRRGLDLPLHPIDETGRWLTKPGR